MTDSTISAAALLPDSAPLRITEGPVVYVPHEELSLVDAAVVLVRRWLWVVVGIIVGLGTSGWWISQSPVRYESRGVVRIGRSRSSFPIKPTKEQQDMLLEPVSVASMRIREEYSGTSIIGQQFGGAGVTSTVFDREADELLTIFARAADPMLAQKFLDTVMQDFVRGHQQLFGPERQVMQDRLQVIGTERERIAKEILSLSDSAAPVEKSPPDSSLMAIKQLTRAQLLQQQLSLEQEAVRLRRDIIDLQSQPTILLSPATVSTTPVEPRTRFFIGLGGLLGIMLGCGLALTVEFVIQVWHRLRTPTT